MRVSRAWMLLSVGVAASVELFSPRVGFAQDEPARIEPVAAAWANDPLQMQVENAIEITRRRYLIAEAPVDPRQPSQPDSVHSPWQIMHGILALRQGFEVKKGDEKVSALEWIRTNPTYRGDKWFEVTPYGGRAHRFTQPYAFEGHPNQFLAIMTMSDLPLDWKIQVDPQRSITIGDMIENAKMEVNTSEEITWTLWAFSRYVPPDTQWLNKYNQPWSMERLVEIQTKDQVTTAACGGTHGLYALSSARNCYLQTGQPLRGVWFEADQKIRRYTEEARSLQNSDGSLSASYFKGRQHSRDFGTRIATSGHTLEFLMMGVPEHRLREEWLRRAVASVAKDLIDNRKAPADCGPLYHALHALVLYRERTRPVQAAAVQNAAGTQDDKAIVPAPEPAQR